jgi:hypothetical protein
MTDDKTYSRKEKVRIVFGPGRNPASSAILLCFEGPGSQPDIPEFRD